MLLISKSFFAVVSLLSTSPISALASTVSATPAQTSLGVGGSELVLPPLLETDLGLSHYRYNIGGGGVNVSNPVRAPETFYQASAHGVSSLTAFVNSAPASLTSGHASCNGAFVNGRKIVGDPSPCGQEEGMMVSANQRAEIINGVYSALQAKGLQNTLSTYVNNIKLRFPGKAAWMSFWTLVSGGRNGLLQPKLCGKQKLESLSLDVTKHFWTYKHFGNFVKLLAMNPNATDTTLSLTFPATVCAVSAFCTSASEDFTTVAPATKSGTAAWSLPLRKMSLTTYTFNRRAC
ncbi:glycoside hydrolase [Mycena albidolilacea]|uniref:Glycoside hydrolase n=1 Tax=Mycena albidolilacea TaxID=1033008 RepID=A0AAD7F1Y1_9AGAR|nr:glycoside hydrolase [Mycena albidolilacea]